MSAKSVVHDAGECALVTDQPVPQETITAFVQAFLTYFAATGTYFWAKYRVAQIEGRLADLSVGVLSANFIRAAESDCR